MRIYVQTGKRDSTLSWQLTRVDIVRERMPQRLWTICNERTHSYAQHSSINPAVYTTTGTLYTRYVWHIVQSRYRPSMRPCRSASFHDTTFFLFRAAFLFTVFFSQTTLNVVRLHWQHSSMLSFRKLGQFTFCFVNICLGGFFSVCMDGYLYRCKLHVMCTLVRCVYIVGHSISFNFKRETNKLIVTFLTVKLKWPRVTWKSKITWAELAAGSRAGQGTGGFTMDGNFLKLCKKSAGHFVQIMNIYASRNVVKTLKKIIRKVKNLLFFDVVDIKDK